MRFKNITAFVCLCLTVEGCGTSDDLATTPSSQATSAAEQTENAAAENGETVAAAPASSPIDTGLTADAEYPVPDLAPAELVGYINQLVTLPARGESEDAFIADQVSRARSRLIAADRIILTKGVTEDLMEAGVRAKLDALRTLAMLDSQGLGVHFQPFVDALNEGDSEKFARMGRISRFWFEVDKLAYSQVADATQLMQQLEQLIAHENAGEAEFLAAQDACDVMNNRGYQDETTKALNLIGQRFLNDEQVGEEAKDLLEKTAFREKVIASMSGNREDIKQLFLSIRDLLQDETKLNIETLDNTLNAAQVLEFNGHFDAADKVFSAIQKAFQQTDDEQLRKQATLAVDFAKKRLGMVGQEVRIEGSHVDGTNFNWSEYKGKVVLVDFWATTSSHWMASVATLKSAYDRFHEAGFEIVGINVDQDRRAVYDYLKSDGLPWPTIIDDVAPGLDANPNAIRYGIRAVPFVMLVGRDGKVTDIHIRGPQLTKRVQELLQKPASQNAQKNDETDRK